MRIKSYVTAELVLGVDDAISFSPSSQFIGDLQEIDAKGL
jgi:hypothetical protein